MKKLLLLLPLLFITYCDCSDLEKQNSGRLVLVEKAHINGYNYEIIMDTKTEKEYIVSGRHSMVEIK